MPDTHVCSMRAVALMETITIMISSTCDCDGCVIAAIVDCE